MMAIDNVFLTENEMIDIAFYSTEKDGLFIQSKPFKDTNASAIYTSMHLIGVKGNHFIFDVNVKRTILNGEVTKVGTATELKNACKSTGRYKLTSRITLPATSASDNRLNSVDIDLNGKTLTLSGRYNVTGTYVFELHILKNGNIVYNENTQAVQIQDGGKYYSYDVQVTRQNA